MIAMLKALHLRIVRLGIYRRKLLLDGGVGNDTVSTNRPHTSRSLSLPPVATVPVAHGAPGVGYMPAQGAIPLPRTAESGNGWLERRGSKVRCRW